MSRRIVSVWFRHLKTDWFSLRFNHEKSNGEADVNPLKKFPFVLRTSSHGRMVITGSNEVAEKLGIITGMALADARAVVPDLQILDDKPGLPERLLKRLAEWCIRFTPFVTVDLPDGLFLDATGCTHLWGGDDAYLSDIIKRLHQRGYDVCGSIADTPGAAWAVARFGKGPFVVPAGLHIEALLPLPPEALRLESETVERMHKLGLHQVRQFIRLKRQSLRRRFGAHFIMRLDMAVGQEMEVLETVNPITPYSERLPCMDPIVTAAGIEIALQQLLEALCFRLQQEQKGLRTAEFKCYRVDGKIESIGIETNRPSHDVRHLFKLFEIQIPTIEPALGIELFVLEAPKVEDHFARQEKMWSESGSLDDMRLSELIDHLAARAGADMIHRYVPDEHYWPERSYRVAKSLQEKSTTEWRTDKLRPVLVLRRPEVIEVMAPIPDYPPMLFRHNGKVHTIVKADGPERIEQEWWLQQGQHRDYYRVEDENGNRYWLFRLGHYEERFTWYLHGFFA